MTCVFGKRILPVNLTECVMCAKAEEKCSHLLFKCPFAQRIWTRLNIDRIGRHVWRGFLGLPQGWSIQVGGRLGKDPCSVMANLAALY